MPAMAGRGQGMPAGFGAPNPAADQWALNDEAIANLGYMQLKKTHDAAMVLMQRIYGRRAAEARKFIFREWRWSCSDQCGNAEHDG